MLQNMSMDELNIGGCQTRGLAEIDTPVSTEWVAVAFSYESVDIERDSGSQPESEGFGTIGVSGRGSRIFRELDNGGRVQK